MIANLEPGIHDLSAEVYHSDPCPRPSLSAGIAKILIKQSAAHAWRCHPRLNPAYTRESDGKFDQGTAAHSLLLERDASKIVIVDADDWRTKAAKEARDEAHAQGKVALLARHYASTEEMVGVAIRYLKTTELGDILQTGDAERSIFWQEDEIWCRMRPDLLSTDRRIIVDYKTTESAAPEDCARVLGSLNYDLQNRFYLRGLKAITGREDAEFVFLFQETKAPYACSLIGLSNSYKEIGDLKANRAVNMWRACMKAQRWDGYSNQVLYAEPKPWALAELESNREES